MRRVGLMILTAVLIPVLMVPVKAEGELGTIRVTVSEEFAESTLLLSYVGIGYGDGLQLMPEFGGGVVTPEDMDTPALLTWLEQQVCDGIVRQVDTAGTAMFSGLPEGVYLLTQKEAAPGGEAIAPTLVRIPEKDGTWLAQIIPRMKGYDLPQTGQPMTPVAAAMGMVISAFGIGIWYENWHKNRKK